MNETPSIEPTGTFVLVKPERKAEQTEGGIYLPELSRDSSLYGVVAAVGQGKQLKNGEVYAPDVKVNDRVLFRTQQAVEVHQGNDMYLLMDSEIDLLAVEEEG